MKNLTHTGQTKIATAAENSSIIVIGANYRTSSMFLRDRLFISKTNLPFFYKKLAELGFREAIILSTTDLTEIILSVPNDIKASQTAEIVKLLSAHAGEPRSRIEKQTYILNGYDAIKHIFAVASALDNLVVGDAKLREELRVANQLSIENNASSKVLAELIKSAEEATDRICRETQIDKRPISIVAAAVQVARDLHGQLENSSGLLIGGGEIGENLASGICSAGLKNLIVSHQSSNRAESISRNLNCHIGEFDNLNQTLIQSDIIITSTNTRKFVLNKDNLEHAILQRRRKPIFIIDTGIPGDVDPNSESLEDIFLYTLDNLEQVTKEGRESRAQEADLAWTIIEEEASKIESSINRLKRRTSMKSHKLIEIEKIREEILREEGIDAEKATGLLISRLRKIFNLQDD